MGQEMGELKKEMTGMAKLASRAQRRSLAISSETKNQVLKEMADALIARSGELIKANKLDLKTAKAANCQQANDSGRIFLSSRITLINYFLYLIQT